MIFGKLKIFENCRQQKPYETVMQRRAQKSLPKDLPNISTLRLPQHNSRLRARLILKLLRRVARRSRQSTAIRFYSIRAVATRFHISPTIITRHYNALQSEGLLTTIWGAKTIIPPRQEHVKTKALVIPVSVALLAESESYRNYILSLHRRLRSLGSPERLIFFEASTERSRFGH